MNTLPPLPVGVSRESIPKVRKKKKGEGRDKGTEFHTSMEGKNIMDRQKDRWDGGIATKKKKKGGGRRLNLPR